MVRSMIFSEGEKCHEVSVADKSNTKADPTWPLQVSLFQLCTFEDHNIIAMIYLYIVN